MEGFEIGEIILFHSVGSSTDHPFLMNFLRGTTLEVDKPHFDSPTRPVLMHIDGGCVFCLLWTQPQLPDDVIPCNKEYDSDYENNVFISSSSSSSSDCDDYISKTRIYYAYLRISKKEHHAKGEYGLIALSLFIGCYVVDHHIECLDDFMM